MYKLQQQQQIQRLHKLVSVVDTVKYPIIQFHLKMFEKTKHTQKKMLRSAVSFIKQERFGGRQKCKICIF